MLCVGVVERGACVLPLAVASFSRSWPPLQFGWGRDDGVCQLQTAGARRMFFALCYCCSSGLGKENVCAPNRISYVTAGARVRVSHVHMYWRSKFNGKITINSVYLRLQVQLPQRQLPRRR